MALGAAGPHIWLICPQRARGWWGCYQTEAKMGWLTCMKMLMSLVPQKRWNVGQGRWKREAGTHACLEWFPVNQDFKTSHKILNEEACVQEKKCTMTPIVLLHRKRIFQQAPYNRSSMNKWVQTWFIKERNNHRFALRKHSRDFASCINYSLMLFITLI